MSKRLTVVKSKVTEAPAAQAQAQANGSREDEGNKICPHGKKYWDCPICK